MQMSVHVPFAFQAAGVELPAGDYTVRAIEPSGILQIRDVSCRHVALLATRLEWPSSVPEQSKLIFLNTGEAYRLVQIEHRGEGAQFHVWGGGGSRRKGSSQVETLVAVDQ